MYFVNKRYVRDKTLSSATEQAYKGLMPIGKFAFCVLNIQMPANKVDVNVHPAKLEVRFEEEGKVFKAVYHAIRNSLLSGELVREPEKNLEEPKKDEIFTTNTIPQNLGNNNSHFANLFKKHKMPEPPETVKDNVIEELFKQKNIEQKSEMVAGDEVQDEKPQQNITVTPSIEKVEKMTNLLTDKKSVDDKTQKLPSKEFDEMYTKLFGEKPASSKQEAENIQYSNISLHAGENMSVFEKDEEYNVVPPDYKFIGIAFLTYIIIELGQDVYLIDQHAAHERVMYEKIKKNYYASTEKCSQLMLVPDVINLTHKEISIVRENEEMFERIGFEFEEFGDNTIKLTGVPDFCMELNTKQLFLDILDEIDTVALTARQEKEDKFIATIACKSAVKAGMKLSQEEVDNLIKELLVLQNPFTCPHGRPTAIKMNRNDLERKFHRR